MPEGLTIPEVAALAAEKLGVRADSFAAAARDSVSRIRAAGDAGPVIRGLSPAGDVPPSGRHQRPRAGSGDGGGLQVRMEAGLECPPGLAQDEPACSWSRWLRLSKGRPGPTKSGRRSPGSITTACASGMALQADPTVQYAIMLKRGRKKSRLFIKDYQFASPYNTYLNPGLPPGPVNSPSRRSIEAALYPAPRQLPLFRGGTRRASRLLEDVQRASAGDSKDPAVAAER